MHISLPVSSGLLRATSQALSCSRFTLFRAPRAPPCRARGLHATAMSYDGMVNGVVQTQWLADNLPDVTVLDASWHMARANRDAEAEYQNARIPGARRFDIDAEGLSDLTSPYSHMLPKSAAEFGDAVRALGVCKSKPVVVYSASGFIGAARAWWMFRLYGKSDVGVLDGGFQRWQAEGRSTESGPSNAADVADDDVFVPTYRPELARDMRQMLTHAAAKDATVVDVRSYSRFLGEMPDPRSGIKSGHIPNSISLPYGECIDDESGKLKSKDELIGIFSGRGLMGGTEKKPVVTTCGSGVTACIVALAMHVADGQDVAVYDGSWSEYGSHAENPVEVGAGQTK